LGCTVAIAIPVSTGGSSGAAIAISIAGSIAIPISAGGSCPTRHYAADGRNGDITGSPDRLVRNVHGE
jgi:hypothetical protein